VGEKKDRVDGGPEGKTRPFIIQTSWARKRGIDKGGHQKKAFQPATVKGGGEGRVGRQKEFQDQMGVIKNLDPVKV